MSYSLFLNIGKITEPARQIRRCPSYYAADWEILDVVPGVYDLFLQFNSGYTVPMPYYVCHSINTIRLDGALYSGFGGVNFASTPLKKGEAVSYYSQSYASTGLVLFPQSVRDRIQWNAGMGIELFDWQKNNITEWAQLRDKYGAKETMTV